MNHQETMDKAYAVWQANEALSYMDFLRELDARERFAVVLGNLNRQVQNGGWSQWVYNGYSDAIDDVRWALRKLDTETSRKVLGMVEIVATCLGGDEDDEEGVEALDELHGLSEGYYTLDDTLMAEVEAFLAAW